MSVKRGKNRRGALARRLDGWQPGLLAVLVAWSTAVLVVPRPIPPSDVPEPVVTPRDLAALRAQEGALALRAREDLPAPVRALGSAVRALGAAEGAGDTRAAGIAQQGIAEAVRSLPPTSFSQVAALRAYQTEAFIAALRAWETTGVASEDLVELGGGLFHAIAARCVTDEDGRRRLAMDDDELGAAFRKRWTRAIGAREGHLQPSLLEERILFAFALRNPRAEPIASSDARTASALAAQALLRRIEQHGRIDPDYPVEFARGVVLYRAGQHARAVQAFNRHLERHPDGPLAARAQNHARAAVAAEVGDPPSSTWLSL